MKVELNAVVIYSDICLINPDLQPLSQLGVRGIVNCNHGAVCVKSLKDDT